MYEPGRDIHRRMYDPSLIREEKDSVSRWRARQSVNTAYRRVATGNSFRNRYVCVVVVVVVAVCGYGFCACKRKHLRR